MPAFLLLFVGILLVAIGIMVVAESYSYFGNRNQLTFIIPIVGLCCLLWFGIAILKVERIELGIHSVQIVNNIPIIVEKDEVVNLSRIFNRNIEKDTKIRVTATERHCFGVNFDGFGHRYEIVK